MAQDNQQNEGFLKIQDKVAEITVTNFSWQSDWGLTWQNKYLSLRIWVNAVIAGNIKNKLEEKSK